MQIVLWLQSRLAKQAFQGNLDVNLHSKIADAVANPPVAIPPRKAGISRRA